MKSIKQDLKKQVKSFILLILLFSHQSLQHQLVLSEAKEENKKLKSWCWVKPDTDQSKIYKPSEGGPNWGFCDKTPVKEDKVAFKVYVKTPNLRGPETTDTFEALLIGDKGISDKMVLSQKGFQKGSLAVKEVKSKPVGSIEQLRLFTTGTTRYQCEYILVEYESKFWKFDCNESVQCPKKCHADFASVGAQRYIVSVKTSDEKNSGTTSVIYIRFIGSKLRSAKKVLSLTGFETGQYIEKEIFEQDVGDLEGVELSVEEEGRWKFNKIQVTVFGQKDLKLSNKEGWTLSYPSKQNLAILSSGSKKSAKQNQQSQQDQQQGQGQSAIPPSEQQSQQQQAQLPPTINKEKLQNTYDGSALSEEEKKNLIQLTCESIVKNNEAFGPDFQSNFINSQTYLAQCPSGCAKKDAKVLGVGVHPEESSICRSAILDKAMPIHGGIIGITILVGQGKYLGSENKYMGVQSTEFGRSAKSFMTFKVENVDMVESDIRILNSDGQISNQGRLEFRMNSVWGSVSAKGMNTYAVRTICKMLEFNDGVLLNTHKKDSIEICSEFEGSNYCGSDLTPIHFVNMKCNDGDMDVFSCFRDIATESTHKEDAIIQCTNVDYNTIQDPDNGSVRLLNNEDRVASQGNIGRLEMFKDGKWGTVCNKDFGDSEASVACKQMNYNDGKVHGGKGKNGACEKVNGKNYCGKQSKKIIGSASSCKGKENKLIECDFQNESQGCTHQMDVVIKCEGNGDPSGNSQLKVKKKKDPQLGKLPMIPVIELNCQSKAEEPIFRGDPGSIFLVNCPSDCHEKEGIVYGTNIYATKSSICRAGIHSGVLNRHGGLAILVKMPNPKPFIGSLSRDINSLNLEDKNFGFSISQPNSIAKQLSQLFEEKLKLVQKQSNEDKNRYSIRFRPQRSFLQLNSSFLQLESKSQIQSKNIGNPFFQWYKPNSKFIFDGSKTKVSTVEINGQDRTGSLTKFTIETRLIMEKSSSSDTQSIVSHSNCGCYDFHVEKTKNEIIFEQPCTGPSFKTGFYMPINTWLSLALTYDGNIIRFYVNGQEKMYQEIKLQFQCPKNLEIGSKQRQEQFWHGKIDFVKIFDSQLFDTQIKQLSQLDYLNRPFNTQKENSFYTFDKRLCVSPCVGNQLPGTPGAPNPPAEADLSQVGTQKNKESNEGLDEDDIERLKKEFLDTENDTKQMDSKFNNEARQICKIKGSQFEGTTGQKFSITCPNKCADVKDNYVFGTQIYEESSSVCLAAIHYGIISNQQGGQIEIVIANGVMQYQGVLQNGIQSLNYGQSFRSFVIHDNKGEQNKLQLKCEDTASQERFQGQVNEQYAVTCPQNCANLINYKLYGHLTYTTDSSICRAAIHAGALTNQGGDTKIILSQGLNKYVGNKKNGITSFEKSKYVMSFNFMGVVSKNCKFFKEEYQPQDILQNWAVKDIAGKQSLWAFNMHPTKKEQLAISQFSPLGGDFDSQKYGTTLLYKDFDCSEGLFKVNVYLASSVGQTAILFKYDRSTEKDFMALEMNYDNNKKFRFIQVANGQVKQKIEIKDFEVSINTWMRFRIVLEEENVSIFMQNGKLRAVLKMLSVKDSLQTKGTVGFATNYVQGVHFDGVQVQEYDKSDPQQLDNILNSNIFSFDKILANGAGGPSEKRNKYCKKKFDQFDVSVRQQIIKDCDSIQNYCQFNCDELVPKIENIRNYNCYNQCLKVSKKNQQSDLKRIVSNLLYNNKFIQKYQKLLKKRQKQLKNKVL